MRSDLRNFYCATKQQIVKCSQEKHYANNKTVQELHNTQRHTVQYCNMEKYRFFCNINTSYDNLPNYALVYHFYVIFFLAYYVFLSFLFIHQLGDYHISLSAITHALLLIKAFRILIMRTGCHEYVCLTSQLREVVIIMMYLI